MRQFRRHCRNSGCGAVGGPARGNAYLTSTATGSSDGVDKSGIKPWQNEKSVFSIYFRTDRAAALNLIPRGLINRHALETGVEAQARTFSVLSHLSSMLFAQLSHAMGLNDVCDWMRLKSSVLARFGVTPPYKNGLPHDNKRARELCATIQAGEIVVFDKAYVDFDHLNDLHQRGIWWVTRAKDNMKYRALKNHPANDKNILKDQVITL